MAAFTMVTRMGSSASQAKDLTERAVSKIFYSLHWGLVLGDQTDAYQNDTSLLDSAAAAIVPLMLPDTVRH